MSKSNFVEPVYALCPSQETMYFMIKYSLHKNVVQIPTSLAIDKQIDFDLLNEAFNIELQRNDCLRIRFFKEDKQVKQVFLSSVPKVKIPIERFALKSQQEKALQADAEMPMHIFKGENYRIRFFRSYNGRCGIYFNVSHMIMDAAGLTVFYLDLLKIYRALKDGTEMPAPLESYEKYVKKELAYLKSEQYGKDAVFYKKLWAENGLPFYAGVHGPDILEKQRKKNKDPDLRVPAMFDPIRDKCNFVVKHIDKQDAALIFDYCLKNKVAPESLIQFGMRTYCSAINYRTLDTLMMTLCSKRITLAEKNTSGCLVQPIQLRVTFDESDTFRQGLKKIFTERTKLYRHINFPYLSARFLQMQEFKYSPSQGPSCMMFTWLPLMLPKDLGYKFDFVHYNIGRYTVPLYVIAMPSLDESGIDIRYMYRPSVISEENISALHENAVKIMIQGIMDPDTTMGQLMDSIENKKSKRGTVHA